jgi:hypothetical protein
MERFIWRLSALGEAGGDKSRRYKQNLTQWVEAEFIPAR